MVYHNFIDYAAKKKLTYDEIEKNDTHVILKSVKCIMNNQYDEYDDDSIDKLIIDYARRTNLEIGHTYDELGKMIYEFNSLYDEHNVLAKKTEIEYEYYDEGQKCKETILITPGDKITEISFDKDGKQTEKVETRGSVKTWFDENDKPIKRQIDRGTGGIIEEDLS